MVTADPPSPSSRPSPGSPASPRSPVDAETLHPPKGLRLGEVAALSVGFMGPVMAMSLNGIGVAALVGKAVPFTFMVSFAGVLLVAYAFVRLTGRISHAGSVYALAGVTIGPRAGFFGGFALLGTYLFFAACIVGACAVFFETMLLEIGVEVTPLAWGVLALIVGVYIVAMSLRESTIVTRVLLGVGFAGILAMIVLSVVIIARIVAGTAPVTTGLDPSVLTPADASWTAIMTASVFGFLSWAGFESGTSLAEETRNPRRTIPRALLLAVVLAGFLYTFIMFAQAIGFGTDAEGQAAFAGASSTLTQLASTYIGSWYAVVLAVMAFLVALASLLSSVTAASRLVFALARDGFGPHSLALTHEKTGIPRNATLFVLACTLVLVVGLIVLAGAGPVEIYYWYATIATLCMVVAYGMASAGALTAIARRRISLPVWEALVPALAIVYLVYVYVVQVAGQVAPYTYFPWIAGAWCLVGLVIILARPRIAERIGARLTMEDLG